MEHLGIFADCRSLNTDGCYRQENGYEKIYLQGLANNNCQNLF